MNNCYKFIVAVSRLNFFDLLENQLVIKKKKNFLPVDNCVTEKKIHIHWHNNLMK